MARDVAVRKSGIEGKGVFARRDFKKGETVIKWDVSHELTPEEVEKLPREEKRYVAHLGNRHVLMQSPAKYVNHSCGANTHAGRFGDIANRDIRKGEEITADYSQTMETNESMECGCNDKNCRKTVRGKN